MSEAEEVRHITMSIDPDEMEGAYVIVDGDRQTVLYAVSQK